MALSLDSECASTTNTPLLLFSRVLYQVSHVHVLRLLRLLRLLCFAHLFAKKFYLNKPFYGSVLSFKTIFLINMSPLPPPPCPASLSSLPPPPFCIFHRFTLPLTVCCQAVFVGAHMRLAPPEPQKKAKPHHTALAPPHNPPRPKQEGWEDSFSRDVKPPSTDNTVRACTQSSGAYPHARCCVKASECVGA